MVELVKVKRTQSQLVKVKQTQSKTQKDLVIWLCLSREKESKNFAWLNILRNIEMFLRKMSLYMVRCGGS